MNLIDALVIKYNEDADNTSETKNAIHTSNLKGKNGKIQALSFVGFGIISVTSPVK